MAKPYLAYSKQEKLVDDITAEMMRIVGPMVQPKSPSISTFRVEAGLLIRREFRQFLERLKFEGHQIEWLEQRNWLDSTFVVKAPDALARKINAAVEKFAKDTE